MRCNECRDKLPQYSLGVLGASEVAAIQEHLAECPDCRAELEAFERLDEVMTPAAQVAPERDLWPGVAERLQPRRAPVFEWLMPQWSRAWVGAAVAAAVVLMLVVGGLLYNARTPVIESSGEMLAAGYQKEQIIAEWSQPLADDAALGLMLADLEAREGEVW